MSMISIVVPVYNVEKYISKCIGSIIKQTYKDFECLIISDGSRDDSIKIAKEIVQNDSRFKIIEKENGGYGSVLEYAIGIYQGQYLMICDPDDYLDENALRELYNLSISNNADIVIGSRILFYENNDCQKLDLEYDVNEIKLIHNHCYKKGDLNFNDVLMVDCAPHSKLYSRKVIDNIKYLYKRSYTDNILFYTSANKANRIYYTSKPYSYYLQDREGNTITALKSKYIKDHLDVYMHIVELLENETEVNDFIYYLIFNHFKILFYNMKYVSDNINELKEEMFNLLRNLVNHKDVILKYQKIYKLEKSVARFKNRMLLNKTTSKGMYELWLKKILK